MNPPDWVTAWQAMPVDKRDGLLQLLSMYAGLIPGTHVPADPEGIPSLAELEALTFWQALEVDVMTAHEVWLTKTRALFDRRGWDWTCQELMRRSHIREVGE